MTLAGRLTPLMGLPGATGARASAAPIFVTWPAHEGARFVPVRVGTEELARISGETFVINSEKITAALVKHRALMEQRANERLAAQPGASEITLDIGSIG
jgi:hypothetical protein